MKHRVDIGITPPSIIWLTIDGQRFEFSPREWRLIVKKAVGVLFWFVHETWFDANKRD